MIKSNIDNIHNIVFCPKVYPQNFIIDIEGSKEMDIIDIMDIFYSTIYPEQYNTRSRKANNNNINKKSACGKGFVIIKATEKNRFFAERGRIAQWRGTVQ